MERLACLGQRPPEGDSNPAMQNQNARTAADNHRSDVLHSVQPTLGGAPFVFLAPEFGLIQQLLDVGGGTGLMASLLKQYNPHLKITIFDRVDLCDAALELFREKGQSEDLGAHAGDIFSDPFPSGFEAIQFNGVLEMLRPREISILLRKAYDSLPPGGLLLIYGQVGPVVDCPKAPLHCAPPSALQYLDWLHSQKFTPVAYRRCPGRYALLTAIK